MFRWLALIAFLLGTGAAVAADPEIIDADAKFPEGPFVEDGVLYYAQYAASEINSWDGKTRKVLWSEPGSGANAVQRFGDGFIVAAYDSGKIVLLDPAGKTRQVLDKDSDGNSLVGPNDIARDEKGGAYVTLSGPWESGPIVGKIAHVAADGSVKIVADDIHYANGLTLSAEGSTLFVAESEAGRIIRFTVQGDGSLTDRSLFVRLTALGEPTDAYPDGLKLGPGGNLYIGLYSAGRIVVVDASGKLVRKIEVPSAAAPNLAFSADGRTMFVTAVDDKSAAPYPGKVYAVELE